MSIATVLLVIVAALAVIWFVSSLPDLAGMLRGAA